MSPKDVSVGQRFRVKERESCCAPKAYVHWYLFEKEYEKGPLTGATVVETLPGAPEDVPDRKGEHFGFLNDMVEVELCYPQAA